MSRVFSYNYSPNFSTYRRISKSIKFIVIHYTGMSSQSKAIKRLIDEDSKVKVDGKEIFKQINYAYGHFLNLRE